MRTPKLETRNPKLELRNPKPGTRNSKLEPRNPKPEFRNRPTNFGFKPYPGINAARKPEGVGVLRVNQKPATAWYQIVCFKYLDLYHKSPDFGERQHKPRTWKRRFDPDGERARYQEGNRQGPVESRAFQNAFCHICTDIAISYLVFLNLRV